MAVFYPIPQSPVAGTGIDATQNNLFEWDFVSNAGETQDTFRIVLYNVTNFSTPAFDTGVITSSNSNYTLPANSLTNGNTYAGSVTVTSGAVSRTSQPLAQFKTQATPSLSIDSFGTIGQFNTFTATYSQAQGVEVKSYVWRLYDNSDVLIEETDPVRSTTIQHTFTGFANSTTYKIEVETTNQNDVVTTSPRLTFTTSYTIPQDSPEINVTSRPEYTSNEIDWSGVIVLNATVNGNYQFVDGKFDRALELQNNACLQLDLTGREIPRNFTISFWAKHNSQNSWRWQLLKGGSVAYEVGWNVEQQRFYYSRGGRFCLSQPITLPTNYYLVAIRPTQINFAFLDTGGNITQRINFQ